MDWTIERVQAEFGEDVLRDIVRDVNDLMCGKAGRGIKANRIGLADDDLAQAAQARRLHRRGHREGDRGRRADAGRLGRGVQSLHHPHRGEHRRYERRSDRSVPSSTSCSRRRCATGSSSPPRADRLHSAGFTQRCVPVAPGPCPAADRSASKFQPARYRSGRGIDRGVGWHHRLAAGRPEILCA